MGVASGDIGPVGVLILHLEPNDGPAVGTLQRHQNLKQLPEVAGHGLGVGRVVGSDHHVRVVEEPAVSVDEGSHAS